jgi:sortase (surface protein transpeptidase)
MNTWTKIKLGLGVCAITLIVILFSMWRIASNNYKIEKENRENAELQLQVAKEENNRLIAYNKKIEKSMKEIEKEYNERFQNIPKDFCGDAMPSQELLEFFKQGAQQ